MYIYIFSYEKEIEKEKNLKAYDYLIDLVAGEGGGGVAWIVLIIFITDDNENIIIPGSFMPWLLQRGLIFISHHLLRNQMTYLCAIY